MKCKFNLLSPRCINSEVTKQMPTPNCKCAQLTSVVETQHYVYSREAVPSLHIFVLAENNKGTVCSRYCVTADYLFLFGKCFDSKQNGNCI